MSSFQPHISKTLQLLIVAVLVTSTLTIANETSIPRAINRATLEDRTGRIQPALLRGLDPETLREGNDKGPTLLNVILKSEGTAFNVPLDTVKQEQQAFLADLRKQGIGFELSGEPMTGLLNMVPLRLTSNHDVAKIHNMDIVTRVYVPSVISLDNKGSKNSPRPDLDKREVSDKPNSFASYSLMMPHISTGVSSAHARQITGKGAKVAIIDTGIDASHPALGNGCYRPGQSTNSNCLIAKFVDFVDKGNKVPKDCGFGGHGTKVAGVIAGRFSGVDNSDKTNKRFVGVAPDARLYVYRVYDCDAKGVSDSVSRALEMAVKDGVDVINMSLGEADPWNLGTVGNIVEKIAIAAPHVSIVSVAGNDGKKPFKIAGPGSRSPILSVGSIDNRFMLTRVMTVSKTNIDYLYSGTPQYVIRQSDIPRGEPIVVLAPYLQNVQPNKCDDYDFLSNLAPQIVKNRAVLLYQGICPSKNLEIMAERLKGIGARAVILALTSNDLTLPESRETMHTTAKWAKIPANLAQQAFTKSTQNIPGVDPNLVWYSYVPVTLLHEDHVVRNSNAGKLSAFSSFGPTALFDLKPELVAIGGSILTTQPMDLGGWGVNDGTSFAAPYVAGCIALLRQAAGKRLAAKDTRHLLLNTAVPAFDRLQSVFGTSNSPLVQQPSSVAGLVPLPVQGQGAGLISVRRALLNLATVGPEPTWALLPPGLFSATNKQTTPDMTFDQSGLPTYARTLTITNPLDQPLPVAIRHMPAMTISNDDRLISGFATSLIEVNGQKPSDQNKVTLEIPPKGTASVLVRLTPDQGATRDTGALFSGYLKVSPQDLSSIPENVRSVYVPYAGFNGDLSKSPVFPRDPHSAFALASVDGMTNKDTPIPWDGNPNKVIPIKFADFGTLIRVSYQCLRPSRKFGIFVYKLVPPNPQEQDPTKFTEEYAGFLFRGEYLGALQTELFWSQDTYPIQRYNPETQYDAPVPLGPAGTLYRIKMAAVWGKRDQPISDEDLALAKDGATKVFNGPIIQVAA